jgi:hypothetical protein
LGVLLSGAAAFEPGGEGPEQRLVGGVEGVGDRPERRGSRVAVTGVTDQESELGKRDSRDV